MNPSVSPLPAVAALLALTLGGCDRPKSDAAATAEGTAAVAVGKTSEPAVATALPPDTLGDEQTLEIKQLDGVELLENGDKLISSWGNSSVVRLNEDGAVTTVVSGVDSPADIGVDTKRERLLIPLFMENKVTFKELE